MTAQNKNLWAASGPYEQYIGRWSRVVARAFAAWLDLPAGLRWGDVGCGTGAVAQAVLSAAEPQAVAAIDRSGGFLAGALASITDSRARFAIADAAALPWKAGVFDSTVSGLVLNFVRDHAAMLREMARVTRPGGTVAVYVWDYAAGMEMIRRFWDAAALVDPSAAALDQGERFPICSPEPLRQLFRSTGLSYVEVRPIEIATTFRGFDDYWQPFLGAQGPAPSYLASQPPHVRAEIRERLRASLPAAPDGSIPMMARAWAARGAV